MKSHLITLLIGIAIGGIIAGYLLRSESTPVQLKLVKSSHTYIKKDVRDYATLMECYKSRLKIGVTYKNPTLTIVAEDKCRRATRVYRFVPRKQKHTVIFTTGYSLRNGSVLGMQYYYNLFNSFGVGGGISGNRNNLTVTIGCKVTM